MYGAIRVHDLAVVREILLKEGFYDASFLQIWKEGQVFGYVKPFNDLLEVHVRGYIDNTLDAEVELSREYLQHPYDVKPFYGYLMSVLAKHGIPYEVMKPIPPDPCYVKVPGNLIKWKPLALSIIPVIMWSAIIGVALIFTSSKKG